MPVSGDVYVVIDVGHDRVYFLGVWSTQSAAQTAVAQYRDAQALLRYSDRAAASVSDADDDSIKWRKVPANTLITDLFLRFRVG